MPISTALGTLRAGDFDDYRLRIDVLQLLLQESEDDEGMMRDYVMGFGYR